MKKIFLIPILLLALNLSGCPSLAVAPTPVIQSQVAVTQTLNAVGAVLKTTPGVLNALYDAGKITKATYNEAATAYNQALASYQLAVSALNTAVSAGQDPNNATAYITALAAFMTKQDNLNSLLTAVGGAK